MRLEKRYAIMEHEYLVYENSFRRAWKYAYHPVSEEVARENTLKGMWAVFGHGQRYSSWMYIVQPDSNVEKFYEDWLAAPSQQPLMDVGGNMLTVGDYVWTNAKAGGFVLGQVMGFGKKKVSLKLMPVDENEYENKEHFRHLKDPSMIVKIWEFDNAAPPLV